MVLKLEEELQNLQETVWLATGVAQIKELWNKLLEQLNQEHTSLSQAAQEVTPMRDHPLPPGN